MKKKSCKSCAAYKKENKRLREVIDDFIAKNKDKEAKDPEIRLIDEDVREPILVGTAVRYGEG